MVKITLKCVVCGIETRCEADRKPAFGFEFESIVRAAGWISGIDYKRHIVHAFCSERCRRVALTKDGKSYRKYIPTLPQINY